MSFFYCLKYLIIYHYIHRIYMKGEIRTMIGNFDDEAQNILNNAKIEMNNLGHPYVGTEHLLLSILNSDNDIVNRLNEYDLTYNFLRVSCVK